MTENNILVFDIDSVHPNHFERVKSNLYYFTKVFRGINSTLPLVLISNIDEFHTLTDDGRRVHYFIDFPMMVKDLTEKGLNTLECCSQVSYAAKALGSRLESSNSTAVVIRPRRGEIFNYIGYMYLDFARHVPNGFSFFAPRDKKHASGRIINVPNIIGGDDEKSSLYNYGEETSI